LTKTNYHISDTVVKTIAGFAVGYLSKDELDKLLSDWESEAEQICFTQSSENNLLRMLNSLFDKVYFLKDCLAHPHYSKAFLRIASFSNYLTDIVVRNPEYLYWALSSESLDRNLNGQKFQIESEKAVNLFRSFSGKVNAIKAIKRKYMLRIGLRDNLGFASVLEITNDLSILAKTLSAILFSICYDELKAKFQIEELNRKYCIIALGKLGGNELNYSSDIDLMIFYDKNTKLKNGKEYHELLAQTIQLFVEHASQATDKGFLFRVDFRLRPDGKNSPLARTLTDTLRYYESRGEDWERQMLLKTSYLGGDEKLYVKFADYISNFIFPKNFSVSPIEQIKKLRKNILDKIKSEQNIKLSRGGIRDIEFSLQALQLLNGGKYPSLQTGNSLIAIDELQKFNLLKTGEAQFLTNAYIFFRRIEHFLQLMNDAQTHTIPESGEILEKLSAFLDFSNKKDFERELADTKNKVHAFYRSVTQEEKPEIDFSILAFKDVHTAKRNYQFLKTGVGIFNQKTFDSQTISLFEKIEPELMEQLSKAKHPDTILQTFARVIRHDNFPSMWYETFQNKKVFEAFLTICEYGKFPVSLFAEDNLLKELFLTGKVFEELSTANLETYPIKAIQFLLSVQALLKIITVENASKLLSDAVFLKLRNAVEIFITKEKNEVSYFVAVQGSLAASQFTFTSDLDLIFMSGNEKDNFKLEKIFTKLLHSLQKDFSPIEVDCRLRPEGKTSQMVRDLQSYENYFESRIRTWEMQALCKLEFVYGDENLFNQFEKLIVKKIKSLDENLLRNDIYNMHKQVTASSKLSDTSINLKKGIGSLLEADFLMQFFLLKHASLYKSLRNKSAKFLLQKFVKQNILSKEDCDILLSSREFLRKLDTYSYILFEDKKHQLSFQSEEFLILSEFLNFAERKDLQTKIKEVQNNIHLIFSKYLNNT
jgi:glutamate-ammonia-ligase adenylyltransferase